ncbi:manganese/iron transport system permease protein [Lampropedia hyalina DSM 16112]|jgi:manganese/iron transport system permease protein|uniref:Manganese/iron transport system permease protein n=1 Tax=Lampropedia hyalina DSM 16112 TaxID=1122156 RepID=A0A1M5ADP7_9BURK|nr:metal ABC transporter permease [Lampropedia hyalina]SHF28410.1 manganese/iron transport system permease protein [Lampropedia hyalina DSM 16112]
MNPEWLWLPLQFDFMRFALAIAAIVAIPTALLSCFLVLKGWALLGDAISHAVFPGVVLAYVFSLPLAVGAFAAGMVCALATGYLHENSRIKQDTVMGVVFSGMFALGLLLYVWIESDVHLDHILFGDILGSGWRNLLESGGIALVISLWIAFQWKDLLLHAFDPVQARTAGLATGWLHYGLLAAVSLAVVGALQAVGIVLSIALLIAPGAIAFLIVRTFGQMLLVASGVALLAAVAGVFLSFYLNSAPAPTIVVLLSLIFILTLCLTSWHKHRTRTTIHPEVRG